MRNKPLRKLLEIYIFDMMIQFGFVTIAVSMWAVSP